MKVHVYAEYAEMSTNAADFIIEAINQKPDLLLCFPAGSSPADILSCLVGYAREGKVDFSRCRFVGLDEWVGMDETDEGSCKHFMYESLFKPLSVKPENIMFFDSKAQDLVEECKRVDKYISENGPIDLMLVGVGMNGHIGLNEPGISFDLYSHVMELDTVTKKVAQKYFNKETELDKGISLGLKHLMEAHVAVMIAAEAKKADIIRAALEGEVSDQVPASILQTHRNSHVFLDKDAASKLSVVQE